MRARSHIIVVTALSLALAGCAKADVSGPGASATGAATVSAVASSVSAGGSPTPVQPLTVTGASIAGIDSGQLYDQHAYVHVTWPVIPGADALNTLLHKNATAAVDDYLANEKGEFGSDKTSHPELNSSWALVAAHRMIGVLETGWLFAGASGAESWRTTWYDTASARVLNNMDLIKSDQRGMFAKDVADAAVARYGSAIDRDYLIETVNNSGPDVVVPQSDGTLLVGFSSATVASGSTGLVTVTLNSSQADQLLSDEGTLAQQSAVTPAEAQASTPLPTTSTMPVATSSTTPSATSPSTTLAASNSSAATTSATQSANAGRHVDCSVLKCIAITYDDGPASLTKQVGEVYASRGERVTFFEVGQQVATFPKMSKAVYDMGHEIGIHTWDHPDLTKLSEAAITSEITRTRDALEAAGVPAPTLLRPPYGATNSTVKQVATKLGLAQIFWSIDTLDWKDRNTALVTQRVLSEAKRGSIVLMHDIHPTTVAAAPAIADGLKKQGFTLVTVSELLNPKPGVSYPAGW